jgi:hypothetical protein
MPLPGSSQKPDRCPLQSRLRVEAENFSACSVVGLCPSQDAPRAFEHAPDLELSAADDVTAIRLKL